MRFFLYFIIITTFFSFKLSAQDSKKTITIFLKCSTCNTEMIKQDLKDVSFVRDQKDADVFIFFTEQRNASDGISFEIEFIGQKKYEGLNDKLYFNTKSDDSDLEITNKILKFLRLGLLRFWLKNGMADRINISIQNDNSDNNKEPLDKWNKWSFNIGANGWFNGEEKSNFFNIRGNISGEQITEKNKFKFRLGLINRKSTFKYDGAEIISEKKSKYFAVNDVISLNEHWSTGMFAHIGSSLYNNYNFYMEIQPGVEYNFYPYSESAKKQIVISYKIGLRHNNYYETTIFNVDKELLWQHNLLVGASFKEKWGDFSAGIQYENFLHDVSLNEFNFDINTNIRIFKGLSLRFYGNYSITHNQINLSANGASLEEMLLQQRQIQSGYNYFISSGLNYTFGSIYNTVINSRFDF